MSFKNLIFILNKEISKLLSKNVISTVKEDGSYAETLDLKQLNKFL